MFYYGDDAIIGHSGEWDSSMFNPSLAMGMRFEIEDEGTSQDGLFLSHRFNANRIPGRVLSELKESRIISSVEYIKQNQVDINGQYHLAVAETLGGALINAFPNMSLYTRLRNYEKFLKRKYGEIWDQDFVRSSTSSILSHEAICLIYGCEDPLSYCFE
jgi:hypothetical protein